MEKNKIKEYPTTRFQFVAQIVTLVCVAVYFIVLIAGWGSIPDEIPMHYNGAGEVDRMGSKSSIIALAIVMGIMYLIFSGLQYLPLTWNMETKSEAVRRKLHNIIRNMLITINFMLVVIFSYITWCVANGTNLGVWFTTAAAYGSIAITAAYLIALYIANKKDRDSEKDK